ncbi:MAG TPA: GNAT family N-acetyltransferase [Pseudomonadales bacterium]|nr:GNAT family N-acetyltransferase [Pseudomonadales bacterium]
MESRLESAVAQRHRVIVVLSGERERCLQAAQQLYLAIPAARVWLGHDDRLDAVAPGKARQVLGGEYALAVVDTWSGLHPDALAAVAGTVVAGGVLLLLVPPWAQWADAPDSDYERLASYPLDWRTLPTRFLAHARNILQAYADRDQLVLVTDIDHFHADFLPALAQSLEKLSRTAITEAAATASLPMAEQQSALDALLAHNGVSVLLAERGRGKSAVLGFAARECLQRGLRVLLCAPSRAAAGSVFRHAGVFSHDNMPVDFCAPDNLLLDATITADILLIDEAAAIPLPMLLQLLQRFPHCVLATTTDGYEGTGQGFVLRFLRELDVLAPGWQHLPLQSPVRWGVGDPLEQCLYEMLLLGARESRLAVTDAVIDGAQVEWVPQQALLENPALLLEMYGLLRSAHYRTTPDDLRFLLDGPAVSVYRLHHANQTLAVALLVEEGSLDAAMVAAIAAGKRRPRGHMLVQTLAVHLQQSQYLQQRVGRVVRIAVHTQCQRAGLGSRLLQAVIDDQQQRGVHCIGSSFSATPDVLSFWINNGFELLRIGHKRQASSAAPAALVLKKGVRDKRE